MADLSYFKSPPAVLMLIDIICCLVAIGCGASKEGFDLKGNDNQAYIFAAACITLIIVLVMLVLGFLGKLSDDRVSLVALIVCVVLMIIAVGFILYERKYLEPIYMAYIAVCIATAVLVFQTLLKLGMVKSN